MYSRNAFTIYNLSATFYRRHLQMNFRPGVSFELTNHSWEALLLAVVVGVAEYSTLLECTCCLADTWSIVFAKQVFDVNPYIAEQSRVHRPFQNIVIDELIWKVAKKIFITDYRHIFTLGSKWWVRLIDRSKKIFGHRDPQHLRPHLSD